MIRQPLLVANWKMHGTAALLHDIARTYSQVGDSSPLHTVICPPFHLLETARTVFASLPVSIGAQNCWEGDEKTGAFTGDISASMLHECGCRYVIIGHSERRRYHQETHAVIEAKCRAILQAGLTPILCVGETAEERAAKQTNHVIQRQLQECLPLSLGDVPAIIAYEPLWAIGTGVTATAESIEDTACVISDFLQTHTPFTQPLILYGGSVSPDTLAAIMACPSINGALIGGSSLKPDAWMSMMQQALSHKEHS